LTEIRSTARTSETAWEQLVLVKISCKLLTEGDPAHSTISFLLRKAEGP
jgi:hypothetical protein